MIVNHYWVRIYNNSDVEECTYCPLQRRAGSSDELQYRASRASEIWVDGREKDGSVVAPACIPSTEKLEMALKETSSKLEADKFRFCEIRDELKRRRETTDEQPVPLTSEELTELKHSKAAAVSDNLILKITTMEQEQAHLVIEAESAKMEARRTQERLELVCKHALAGTLKTYLEKTGLSRDAAPAVMPIPGDVT